MGDQNLELDTNESEIQIESSYKVITYPASQLPQSFLNVIIAPFMNSLRYGNYMFKLIDKQAFYRAYKIYIDMLLSRPESVIKMALLNDDTVLGWSLFENKTLHYIWVKKEVRRQGIGKSLLPKEFDKISHITNKGLNIWVSKFPEVRFDPFA